MEPLFSKFFDDFKVCVAPENKGDIRASYAVPQVALNSRGSLDVGWDMTNHRKRGAPSGSVNFVFVSCGTPVHLERHEKIRNIYFLWYISLLLLLFLTFSVVANPKKTTLHDGQSRSWSAEHGKENIVQLD